MKILIIGGLGQGKLAYARSRYGIGEQDAGGPDTPSEALWQKPLLYDVHLLIRKQSHIGGGGGSVLLNKLAGRDSWIVICDEVGCGVVPMDPMERRWREEVGRVCCALAKRADIVERVYLGIAQRIKG